MTGKPPLALRIALLAIVLSGCAITRPTVDWGDMRRGPSVLLAEPNGGTSWVDIYYSYEVGAAYNYYGVDGVGIQTLFRRSDGSCFAGPIGTRKLRKSIKACSALDRLDNELRLRLAQQ